MAIYEIYGGNWGWLASVNRNKSETFGLRDGFIYVEIPRSKPSISDGWYNLFAG